MQQIRWIARAIVVAALVASAAGQIARAGEPPAAQQSAAAWAPEFYGFCMEIHDARRRTMPEQAEMLRRLGFDGVGYPLWLDENLEKNLAILDKARLKVYLLYVTVNLAPGKRPYDPRLPQAMAKLKGRPVTISVLLRGFPPGDPRGDEPAVKILRKLGDLAAKHGLRISIYHHTGDWTASLIHALQVVRKTNHPQVGANFNLCHWLKIDGDKDYRPVLRENADKIFAVTINGAKLGSKTWTNGLIQPLDGGDFDNRCLLATLRKNGYRGPVGLMCFSIPGDAQVHLQRSIKLWNTWEAEWAAK